MKITDYIRRAFRRGGVLVDGNLTNGFSSLGLLVNDFGSLVWLNICDLICDLIEQVRLTEDANMGESGRARFTAFRRLIYDYGHAIWQKVLDEGYVVVGIWEHYDEDENGVRSDKVGNVFYRLLRSSEYTTTSNERNDIIVTPTITDPDFVGVEVVRSTTYATRQVSDLGMCRNWIKYIDAVMSASDTCVRRLGAVVIASPKNLASANTFYVLTEKEKTALETQLQEEYGTLRNQKSVMVLPREMSWQTVSLANLDTKLNDKMRLAILAICDRIKVPANQVAIIDANSSKSLSNGSELREGDKMKYKTARRLFEATFVQLANDLGIKFTYIFEGEPAEETTIIQTTTE